jgi:hypothetical protein
MGSLINLFIGGFVMEKDENSNRNLKDENAVERNNLSTARKEGLRRGAVTAAVIGIIILIVAGVIGYSMHVREHDKQLAMMENQKNMYTTQLASRDSTINDWLLTIDQIEKDLSLIKQKENMVTLKSSGSELSGDKRAQVLADIKDINTLLDNNRKKIASLNAIISSSNGTIKGLQARVTTLETTLKQYESNIAELKVALEKKDFEINQLNVKVAGLDSTVSKQGDEIKGQTEKLNQAYVVSGTFKELKEKGIISKEGFLGIGKKGSLIADVPEKSFTKIDITQTKMIPVHSKAAKLITKHPSNSYAMVPEAGDKVAYIEVKDPEMFWKISKYAVVEIGK